MHDNVEKWIVKSHKVKEKMFTLSLSGVKEGASYEFRVSAVNKAGQGPASATSPSPKYGQQSYRFILYYYFFMKTQCSTMALSCIISHIKKDVDQHIFAYLTCIRCPC